MNATIKTFATFSLSAAVGQMMIDTGEEKERWRGKKLYESGLHASAVYPSHHLTAGAIERIGKAVDALCSPVTPIEKALSMLLASLVDIRAHVKKDRHAYIDPLVKRVRWAMDLYRISDDVHVDALEQYQAWEAS